MENKKNFFILYPRVVEEEARSVVDKLNDRLSIDYRLWSYAEVEDEQDYLERFIQPEIERADVILALVAKDTNEDYLLKNGCKYASDRDLPIVPIKIGKGKLRAKNWSFRTDIVDFDDEEERIKLVTNLYSWLGLRKRGDIYGSKITLCTDTMASVTRDGELIGNVAPVKKLEFNLTKGNGEFTVQSGNNWNTYSYQVPDNDGKIVYEVTLKDNIMLSNTPVSRLVFDPLVEAPPKWDATERTDFKLSASSEDNKKRQAIVDSYERLYKATIRPYPDYDTKEFRNRGYLFLIAIIACIFLGAALDEIDEDLWWLAIPAFFVFILLRGLRKRQLAAWNRRKKRKMEERVAKFNHDRWLKCMDDMNMMLADHGLQRTAFANLGTPSQFVPTNVDTLRYEEKAENLYRRAHFEEAFQWYRFAAVEGSAEAQYILANMYLKGEGTPVNYKQASQWFHWAAAQRDRRAQFSLGNMFYTGLGVRKDYVVALKWYLRAAEQGHAEAQENAALLLYTGKGGVKRNERQYAKWFGKAAVNGLSVSQYHYGRCLELGRGVRRDYSEAALWYRKAAEAGVTDAMLRLSNLYRRGRGVETNREESQRWRLLAEENQTKAK